MWVYVCIYVHTLHTGYSDVSPVLIPGIRTRQFEGPTKPDGLNLGIYVFVHLYEMRTCINMLGGGMRFWTNWYFSLTCFSFQKRKAKDVNIIWISQIQKGSSAKTLNQGH